MRHIHPRHVIISSSQKHITCDPIPLILILANSINLIGCIEVTYRVYCKKCIIGRYRSLPLDSKFSLYIAITNGLFVVMQIVDMMLTSTNTIKPGIICDITGKFSPSFLTLNLLSVMSFTYLMYLKICKNIDSNEKIGKWDWKVWKFLFLVSWVATIFGLNRYEPQSLWCTNQPEGIIIHLANIMFIISILIPTLIFYFKLKNINMDQMSIVEKYVPIHPHIIRNAASYLIVFFLQWICVLIYNLTMLYEINDKLTKTYLKALLILGVNFGGFGNAIVYIINEYRTNINDNSNGLLNSISNKYYGSLA
ncbi:hypothetical protein C1645_786387 [Glomus cerebriforme]|uniref:G-protein coupled receptors family 1 profile domain-containing protein n=1 Tax=Glomus cerebriforme TaxID=658196 RepID=A0A397SAE7_9GLOM|nr:hypothetical protein C1645_786757 [Glomus cerebriforme]RIA83450.1 hypothetical protein C1645_786387 [Glomus cerebriforme]